MKFFSHTTHLLVWQTGAAMTIDSLNRAVAARTLKTATSADDSKRNTGRQLLIRDNKRNPKLLPQGDQPALREEEDVLECDAAFFDCVMSIECDECFTDLRLNDINWAGVTENTDCGDVVQTLQKNNLCKSLVAGTARDRFCNAFHSCIYFEDEDDDNENKNRVDCDALEKCEWPGMHMSFIGDGACHDSLYSCYNTEICGWDGGDCCEDTCKSSPYIQCGMEGYACRNPESKKCDPVLAYSCHTTPDTKPDGKDVPIPECGEQETVYRLVMNDSFGDGWENTKIKITASADQKQIYAGGLESGSEGYAYLCLSLKPSCFNVEVGGGDWGREASWYIRGFAAGSPNIASGGGSTKCAFSVSGGDCETTCNGKTEPDPTSDPGYRGFKDMKKCIDKKCMIQAEACNADFSCIKCYLEDVPDYCFSIPTFMALTDCSLCQCTDNAVSDYCKQKAAPGIIVPPRPNGGGAADEPVKCTPHQTQQGGLAVMDFGKCVGADDASLLKIDYDQNNFGELDTFEACARAYNDRDKHGGHTALACLRILKNAMDVYPKPDDQSNNKPTEMIATLAKLLYKDAKAFCDCADNASKNAPLCPSFYNFKTLLYESLDACVSLDLIDCPAWDEFQAPCKTKLMSKFRSADFSSKDQCNFAEEGCGDVGPFPAFRRLDCEQELSSDSWAFYTAYAKSCLSDGVPTNSPTASKKVETKPPTPYQPVKPSNIGPVSPTAPVSPAAPTKPTYKSPDEKQKSHWLRNLFLITLFGGVGYYVYKRRSEGFNLVRYRRLNFGQSRFGGEEDMYSGLALESSTNFEPPSLPPTPWSMPNNGGYGA